jgi:hypothetical protein
MLLAYHAIFTKYLEEGTLEPVNLSTAPEGHVHYLIHFCVPKKDGTARLVLMCNMRRRKGERSLNDCLLKGPDLHRDLVGMLVRSQLHPILVASDLEAAFHKIGIRRQDRDVLRVIWLEDPMRPPTPENLRVYRFTKAVMGATPSPSILEWVLQQHLRQLPIADREWARVAERNLYVDNLIFGGDNAQVMSQWSRRAIEAFDEGRMHLREFLSNDPSVTQGLEPARVLPRVETKLLGVWWDPVADTYTIRFAAGGHEVGTNRQLMGYGARPFDPVGWLVPVTLHLKLILQKVPKVRARLDDPLEPGVRTQLEEHLRRLDLPGITLPRYRPIGSPTRLHVFADASNKALAVAAYLAGPSGTRLILARSRVRPSDWANPGGPEWHPPLAWPPRQVFTPRLELAAVELATRVLQFLLRELDQPVNEPHTIWTDNECTLRWLVSYEQKPVFVENRVRKIRRVAGVQIRYVPTESNPADLGTRGATASELQHHQQWWTGPAWLTHEQSWPSSDPIYNYGDQFQLSEEPMPETALTTTISVADFMDYERHSTWERVIRVGAFVGRFCARTRRGVIPAGPLTVQECAWSWYTVLRDIQRNIQHQPELRCYVDQAGLWRVNSRLDHAALPTWTRNPILLPPDHPAMRLLIAEAHRRLFHASAEATLVALKRHYYIPAGRRTIKMELERCTLCRLLKGKAFQARIPPALPPSRVADAPPFTHVGLDYWGPVKLRWTHLPAGAEPIHCHVALFTCMSVRAVHMELAVDATARTFLLALRRHIGHYGVPVTILTDNGPNFILGRKALALVQGRKEKSRTGPEAANADSIISFTTRRTIRWDTITERAPWRGGVYERMVAVTKESVLCMVGRSKPAIDTFQTLLVEAAAIVNSRPITYITSDLRDPLPLSPMDFLRPYVHDRALAGIGQPVPTHGTATTPTDLEDMWDGLTHRLELFWQRLAGDYRTGLIDRRTKKKALGFDRRPEVGEVVLVGDETAQPRGTWPRARVVQLVESKDGEVRTAIVRTGNTQRLLRRAIEHLYPLEMSPAGAGPRVQRTSAGSLLVYSVLLLTIMAGCCSGDYNPQWRVVGKNLGVGVITGGPHLLVRVSVNVTEGLAGTEIDPDGGWSLKLKEMMCQRVPDLHGCDDHFLSRLKRWVFGVAAVALSALALAKVGGLREDLLKLGALVKDLGRLASPLAMKRTALGALAVAGVAQDWFFISEMGHTPINFWSRDAKVEILQAAGINGTAGECYLQPRVFEAVTEVNFVGVQHWPMMELELRLEHISACGNFTRDLYHLGTYTAERFGRLVLPRVGLFTEETILPVDCRLIRANTYRCHRHNELTVYANLTCSREGRLPTMADCELATRDLFPPSEQCWAEIGPNEHVGQYYLNTNCSDYRIMDAHGYGTAYNSKGRWMARVVHLGAGSTLTVGNLTYTSTRRVAGPTDRAFHLNPWNDTGVTDFERRILAWEEAVANSTLLPDVAGGVGRALDEAGDAAERAAGKVEKGLWRVLRVLGIVLLILLGVAGVAGGVYLCCCCRNWCRCCKGCCCIGCRKEKRRRKSETKLEATFHNDPNHPSVTLPLHTSAPDHGQPSGEETRSTGGTSAEGTKSNSMAPPTPLSTTAGHALTSTTPGTKVVSVWSPPED